MNVDNSDTRDSNDFKNKSNRRSHVHCNKNNGHDNNSNKEGRGRNIKPIHYFFKVFCVREYSKMQSYSNRTCCRIMK